MNANPRWDAPQVIGLVREEFLLESLASMVQISSLNESISGRPQRRDGTGGSDVSIKGLRSRSGCPLACWYLLTTRTNAHCEVCLEEASRYRECSDRVLALSHVLC
jgi:hypothetical protein